MAQKSAFIVDQDRDLALSIAAALRSDGLRVGISEGDRDPLDEIRAERPDIVLLRAEQSGKETGFTLCNRVKKNKRLGATAVFLYTTAGSSETIAAHKTQDTRADDYLVMPATPPFPFDDVRDRVRQALFAMPNADRPPPLPRGGTNVGLPPAPPEPVALPSNPPATSPDDQSFIDRVMGSIGKISDEDAAAAPKIEGRVTTADKKLDLLRQKLRQREAELSKLVEMYRAKERDYHAFNERLVEKDVEAQSLRMTIDELTAANEASRVELDRRTQEFNNSFEQLLEDKVVQEKDLIEVIAGKEKELADLRGELYALTDRTKAEIADLEGSVMRLGQQVKTHVDRIAALEGTISDRDGRIRDLESSLEGVIAEREALTKDNAGLTSDVAELESRVVALARSILDLRADLAETREAANEQAIAFDAALVSREQVIEGLKTDLDAEREAHATDDRTLRGEIAGLERDLSETRGKLSSAEERGDGLSDRLADLDATTRAEIGRLERTLVERGDELDSERASRAATEESLQTDLATAHARHEALTEAKARADQAAAEQIGGLEDKLAKLEVDLDRTRREAEARGFELQGEIDRLDGQKLTLEQELADRDQELSDTKAAAESALAERNQTVAGLEARIAALSAEERALFARKTELEAELDEARASYARLDEHMTSENASLMDTIAGLRKELEESRRQSEDLESDLRGQIGELGADLAEKGDRIDALARALEEETRRKEGAEGHVRRLDAELGEVRGELQGTTEVLRGRERELGQTRETLALREGRLTELAESLAKEAKVRGDREADLFALRAEHDARAAELGRLTGRIAALEESLSSARSENEKLDGKLDDTKRELFTRQAELATARAEASERASRLEELSRHLAARERELAESRAQATELLREKERVTGERDQALKEGERLTRDVSEAESEIAGLSQEKADLEARIDRLGDEIRGRDERIEGVRGQLKQVEDARTELDRTRMGLAADLARTEEARSRLESELDRARAEWAEARSQLVSERDATKRRLAELGEELDATRDARDDALHARELLEEQGRARAELDRQAQEGLKQRIQTLEREHAAREQEMGQEMEVREAHARTLDKELARVREELAEARRREDQADREIAHLTDRVDEMRAEAEIARASGEEERTAAEARRTALEQALQALERTSAERAGRLQAELEESRRQTAEREQELAGERSERQREGERTGTELSHVRSRLDETAARLADTTAEKRASEERARAEVEARDQRAAELEREVERQRALAGERERARDADHKQAVAKIEARVAELLAQIEHEKEDREGLEARYLRELEDTHDGYQKRMAEKESEYRKEMEDLRNGALDAKRQLKASQLAAQRLTDRVQKLETERPSKSGAEEDFEAFMRQYTTRKSQPPGAAPAPSATGQTARPAPVAPSAAATAATQRPAVGARPLPPRPVVPSAPGAPAAASPEPGRVPPHRPPPRSSTTPSAPPPANALASPAGRPASSTGDDPVTQAAPAPGPTRARVSTRRGATVPGGGPPSGEDDVSAMLDGLFGDGTAVGGPDVATDERDSLADDLSLDR